MAKRTFVFEAEVADYDADIFERDVIIAAIKQRFEGTAIKLNYVTQLPEGSEWRIE